MVQQWKSLKKTATMLHFAGMNGIENKNIAFWIKMALFAYHLNFSTFLRANFFFAVSFEAVFT